MPSSLAIFVWILLVCYCSRHHQHQKPSKYHDIKLMIVSERQKSIQSIWWPHLDFQVTVSLTNNIKSILLAWDHFTYLKLVFIEQFCYNLSYLILLSFLLARHHAPCWLLLYLLCLLSCDIWNAVVTLYHHVQKQPWNIQVQHPTVILMRIFSNWMLPCLRIVLALALGREVESKHTDQGRWNGQ